MQTLCLTLIFTGVSALGLNVMLIPVPLMPAGMLVHVTAPPLKLSGVSESVVVVAVYGRLRDVLKIEIN